MTTSIHEFGPNDAVSSHSVFSYSEKMVDLVLDRNHVFLFPPTFLAIFSITTIDLIEADAKKSCLAIKFIEYRYIGLLSILNRELYFLI